VGIWRNAWVLAALFWTSTGCWARTVACGHGHIDETVRNIRGNVGYAQPPQLFLNRGKGMFREVAAEVGGSFDRPKVGRGLAYATLIATAISIC